MTQGRVLLGITGSVAAFKGVQIASDLLKLGMEVRAVLTPGATHFVTPLTLQAVTGAHAPVHVWDEGDAPGHIGHVALAHWADLILVAPASASAIARLTLGLATDMLGACALAFDGPMLMAPAMETNMYLHPATQTHLKTLQQRGVILIGPTSGRLASGAIGLGRMAETSDVVLAVQRHFQPGDLAGRTILITAGPTYEPIDAVRFLANRSSGKMGYALADSALARGAAVILVSGPTSLTPPPGAEIIRVESGADMLNAVVERVGQADATIMAAAVADFRPAQPSSGKVRRSEGLHLNLLPTEDIAARAASIAPAAVHVGFALEPDNLIEGARSKLQRKGLDLVVANQISDDHNPFGSDSNRVVLVTSDSARELPELSKHDVASHILDAVALLLSGKRPPVRQESVPD